MRRYARSTPTARLCPAQAATTCRRNAPRASRWGRARPVRRRSRSKVRRARVRGLLRDADRLTVSPRPGSAIYINSLLFDLSPLYTVTLDGNATDVDGFRTSGTFQCDTLFSRTGLDPTVNHTITLAIKSQSPSATASPGASSSSIFVFSLINFMYVGLRCSVSKPGPRAADHAP
jgi:hypothetical protein